MTSFISYSGDVERVGRLAATLRRHGLRTWRDRDALRQGATTEAAIEEALAACESAMVWLGGDTMRSPFVSNIELPHIFANHRANGLRIVPLFIDTTVTEGCNQVRDAIGEEIGSHNGYVWNPTSSEQDNLGAIASAEAAAALGARARAPAAPRPVVRMVTRSDGAGARDTADLNLDWIPEYPADGALPDDAIVAALQSALHVACQSLIASFGAGVVDLHLKCHLHLGVALGFELRRTTGMLPRVELDGAWLEIHTASRLDPGEELVAEITPGPADASRASIEISVTRDVSPLVNDYVTMTGTRYRKRVRLRPPTGPDQQAVKATNVNAWAEQAAAAVRAAKAAPGVDDVDVFLAAPIGLAVAFGWRLNAIGDVRLLHPVGNAGPYVPVWHLSGS